MSSSTHIPTVDYGGGNPAPTRTSGIAIAAMIVGIISLIIGCVVPVVFGLVAIVLGSIGIAKTGSSEVKGRGFAITGLVCGCVSILLGTAVAISILLPSLNRAREAANRIKCASNLRQIGQSMRMYAIDDVREGKFPPDLETVSAVYGPTPNEMVCPSSSLAPAPPPFVLGTNTSYIYLGGGLTDSAGPNVVVGYCEIHNHHGDGTNVLFGDGSVRFLVPSQFPAEVKPTAGP